MTDRSEYEADVLVEHREALAAAFLRVAQRNPRRRWLRGLAIPAIAVPLATAGLAIAREGPFGSALSLAVPAPPPLFVGAHATYPNCPPAVQRSISEVTDLAAYARTAGYPVAGCPTVEDLRANPAYIGGLKRRRVEGARKPVQGRPGSGSDSSNAVRRAGG